jgi:CDP-diacylglycerol--serine O-phosphatidyltransferase
LTAEGGTRSTPAAATPTILGGMRDAANLLTLAGVFSSMIAITFAFTGQLAGAAVCLAAAFIFDGIDGPVAKRLTGRTSDDREIGANLDSLADVISAGVTLSVVFLAYGDFDAAYVPGALVLVTAATLRLAYFNVHGLEERATTYTGLPTDLAIIIFVAVLLLDGPLAAHTFQVTLYGVVLGLAGLMVSPLRVPKFTGGAFYATIVLAIVLGGAHLVQAID